MSTAKEDIGPGRATHCENAAAVARYQLELAKDLCRNELNSIDSGLVVRIAEVIAINFQSLSSR